MAVTLKESKYDDILMLPVSEGHQQTMTTSKVRHPRGAETGLWPTHALVEPLFINMTQGARAKHTLNPHQVKSEVSIRVIATRLHAYHHTHLIMCVCTDSDCSVELPSRDLKPCSAGQDEDGLQRGTTSEFMHVFVFIKSHTQCF